MKVTRNIDILDFSDATKSLVKILTRNVVRDVANQQRHARWTLVTNAATTITTRFTRRLTGRGRWASGRAIGTSTIRPKVIIGWEWWSRRRTVRRSIRVMSAIPWVYYREETGCVR
jgi:hypothetical protein